MRTRTSFSGDLGTRLAALPPALSKPILQRSLKKAGEPIRVRMSQNAPRRPPAPDLADNIGISVTSKVDGERISDTSAAVAIGPTKDFFYGRFLELGTVKRPARPFARPAFDAGSPEAMTILAAELWNELRKAAAKGFGASFTGSVPSGRGL